MRFYFVILNTLFSLPLFVQCETLTKTYTSYRPYPFCDPSDYMRYPTNSDEVVAIVNEAISRGVKVKAFGARHSQSDIICTKGIPVDMNNLKSFQMNEDNVTATFGSGVTVKEAGEFLLLYGRALRTTPAYGSITLGGAIGTGAHGSSIKYNSTISAQVVSLTVVDGRGEKVVISDSDNLRSFKTHLGLLGIVVEVTLYTVPLYKVLGHNYVVSDTVLTNGEALNWAKTTDQITFYWFPLFKEVVVVNLTFVAFDTTGDAFTSIVPPSYGYFNFVVKKAAEVAFTLTSSKCEAASSLGNTILHTIELISQASLLYKTPAFAPYYTEDGTNIKNPAVGFPHLMFASTCSEENAGFSGTACLWAHDDINSSLVALDNEIGIALTDLKDFVSAVKDIEKKTPTAFPVQGLVFRFSGKSDIYMSTAYQRDTVHVEFLMVKRSNVYNDASGGLAAYQTILQTLAKRFNGRSHWGKSGFVYHNREMLDLKLDSQARGEFVAAMHKFDPNEVFQNNFGRRITENDTKIDSDPKTTRCALLDHCFCSKNSDCAESQRCVSLPGYTYTVCKTDNEIPVQINEISFPPPLTVLDWLVATVPTSVTAVLGKCTLHGLGNSILDVLGSLLG